MNPIDYRTVLTIAGTDPSGGAGIQADIKAISATGAYAASVVTALVAQNTQGVQAIHEIPVTFLRAQLLSVFQDLEIHAVKIGMLHDRAVIETVAVILEQFTPKQVVLDPVMVAKNGCPLLVPEVVQFLKTRLFPLVSLITPNLWEAQKIFEKEIASQADMAAVAIAMSDAFRVNVLLKGGHLSDAQSSDVLCLKQGANERLHWFHADRIDTPHTHGTGCTLSAAIASYVAQDYPLKDAVFMAKHYLTKAIQSGSRLKIGKGRGPVSHFYFLRETVDV